MWALGTLFLLLGCAQNQVVADGLQQPVSSSEPDDHTIAPVGEDVYPGAEPAQGLFLRYSSYGRGRLSSRWEVYDDGRVRFTGPLQAKFPLGKEPPSIWKSKPSLDAEALKALEAFLIEIDLRSIAGYHNVGQPQPGHRGSQVIYAPVLGASAVISVPPGHHCPTWDRFHDEVMRMVQPSAFASPGSAGSN